MKSGRLGPKGGAQAPLSPPLDTPLDDNLHHRQEHAEAATDKSCVRYRVDRRIGVNIRFVAIADTACRCQYNMQ